MQDFCEDAKFYEAFRQSRIPDFDPGYLLVKKDGKRIATVPYFLMDFRPGAFIDLALFRKLPVSMKAAFVGHPSADVGRIDGEASGEVLHEVNDFLFAKAGLVVYKFFRESLPLQEFFEIPGMPIPILKVERDYFADIHGPKRKHLHREIHLTEGLEYREPSDCLPLEEIYRLYLNTYNHGEMQFEKLNLDYFRNTAPISRYLLVYFQGELIGFAQWLQKDGSICGKYLGMDYGKGKPHGIYFAIMLQMIRIAIREGCREIDFGVSGYEVKRRLGCELVPTRVYFRHANPVVNRLLGMMGKWIRLD